MNSEPITLIVSENVKVSVTYDEKGEAKKIQPRLSWNRPANSWIAPAGVDLIPLRKWLPHNYATQVADLLGEEREKGMTLFSLLNQVRGAIEANMSGSYWIRSEILHINDNNHWYLELSDYGEVKSRSAKTKGMIWRDSLDMVRRFEEKTGEPLRAGMKILFKARVTFHEQFGLSVEIQDIDPVFTLGDMQAKVNKIRGKMRLEGILEANKKLPSPKHFTRVAVIAPEQAAGLGDFKTQANGLADYGVCEFDYYSATFQGNQMLPSMEKCFKAILERQDDYDCIVVIRGGGDKQGLYELNEEALTRMLCKSPLPVLIGIGHERDVTILDEVANLRFATPSLVIGHIFGTIMSNAREAKANFLRIKNNLNRRVEFERSQLSKVMMQIHMNTSNQIAQQRQFISGFVTNIRQDVLLTVADQRSQVKSLMQETLLQDPRKVMAKGYAVARDEDNNVITTAEQAEKLSSVTIQFQDGRAKFAKAS